jgi:hypothetical protein
LHTGRVTLQDFLRMLVRDFRIRPRPQYESMFDRILDETEHTMYELEHGPDD